MRYFISQAHKERFLAAIETKISRSGRVDAEYGSAFLLLTADAELWKSMRRYLLPNTWIDVEKFMKTTYLSHGQEVLVRLAGNLFNSGLHVNILELVSVLDDANWTLAMQALEIRRYPPYFAELIGLIQEREETAQ